MPGAQPVVPKVTPIACRQRPALSLAFQKHSQKIGVASAVTVALPMKVLLVLRRQLEVIVQVEGKRIGVFIPEQLRMEPTRTNRRYDWRSGRVYRDLDDERANAMRELAQAMSEMEKEEKRERRAGSRWM
jgi:hypothetical protein